MKMISMKGLRPRKVTIKYAIFHEFDYDTSVFVCSSILKDLLSVEVVSP